jgi:hypothetical protein
MGDKNWSDFEAEQNIWKDKGWPAFGNGITQNIIN